MTTLPEREAANSQEPPVEIARKMVAGEAFTDTDAIRVADNYLWLLDDGAEA